MALPDWSLECIDGAVSCVLRPDAGEPSVLRIGRQVQGQPFWERLVLDERKRATISREHCQIRASGGDLIVVNKSQVGTTVNGLAVQQEQPVHAGDVIGLGTEDPKGPTVPVVQFRICILAARDINRGADSSRAGDKCAAALSPFADGDSWCLQCMSVAGRLPADIQNLAEGDRIIYPQPGQSLKVGRLIQPLNFWEKLIPEETSRNKVSREHFEVQSAPGGVGWILVNLGTAGTLVNGKLVKESEILRTGDAIEVPFRPEEQGTPVIGFCFQGPRSTASLPGVSIVTTPGDSQSCRLSCISVLGRPASAIQAMPETMRVLAMSGSVLKLGRSHQLSFWEALVPDEKARNKVSREHFEVRLTTSGSALELFNVASSGTLLNGTRVKEKAALKDGDIIAVPSTAAPSGSSEDEPVASFEFQASCASATLAGGYAATSSYAAEERPPASLPGREGLPIFELAIISALGLSAVDLSFLQKEQRVWYPEVGARSFRVGRTIQIASVWSAIIPDERSRNSISRDQFEIVMESGPTFFLIPNSSSSSQTLVNGQRVSERTRLEPMDVIGIGSSPADQTNPVVRFRFALETGSVLASVPTLPANRTLAEVMNTPGWPS